MAIRDIKRMAEMPKEMEDNSYKQYDIKNKALNGINSEAHYAIEIMSKQNTKAEFGITGQKIIIPSFGTTSKVFAQHFAILRDLQHKIELLKQAYEYQRSDKRSWEQIDAILDVIEEACKYLDFPEKFDELTGKATKREAKKDARLAKKEAEHQKALQEKN